MPARSVGAVVLLAAGSGSRFGGRKLTAPIFGRRLLQYAIDAACGSYALSCVLVLGADAEAIADCVDTRRCSLVRNDGWREGIASSIRAGLAYSGDAEACCFLLGDQPFVTSADLNALFYAADHHSQNRGADKAGGRRAIARRFDGRPPIVALRSGRVWGAPMVFPRRDFAALGRLKGDNGAKRYAESQTDRLRFVTAVDRRAFTDIDSPADLSEFGGRRAG